MKNAVCRSTGSQFLRNALVIIGFIATISIMQPAVAGIDEDLPGINLLIMRAPIDEELPGRPVLSAPSSDTDGTYTVSWTEVRGDINSYELQEKTGSGSWITVYSGYRFEATFSKTVSESYSYRVRACNRTGCGMKSSWKTVNVTLATVPAVESPADTVGTMPYGVDVTTRGDAAITVPLQLIPGVAGFAPSLALEYNSGRGVDLLKRSMPEDTIGYGWRLAGLSELRRCVVSKSSTASIELSSADRLCLDGMPLLLVSGTDFTPGAMYRTRIESFVKIETKGTSTDLWYEVTLPNGTAQEYGNSVSSRVNKDGGTDYQWSLNKSTSTDGNVIDYSYQSDTSKGVNRIHQIDYADAAVSFEYLVRTDTSPVNINTTPQTQGSFLQTIRVKYDGNNVRDYTLISEEVAGRRRLALIQQCGYAENGSGAPQCLAPLNFNWATPSQTMPGVSILVDGISDGLSAIHQIEYGTITGSSHTFLFTERPFGNASPPTETQVISGSGALRHVATRLRRDNGLGGFHDTSYAYQEQGIESTKHWGFLGFYAQRITDEQSGIVTYAQHRLDQPYLGRLARLHQYDAPFGSHTQTLTRSENDYDRKSISYGSGSTEFPYLKNSIRFIFEGSMQLGATKVTNTPTLSSGFVTKVVSTSISGTGVSEGSAASTWGDVPSYTVSGALNTSQTSLDFQNRTSSDEWLIGFTTAIENQSWLGAGTGVGIIQDAVSTPHANSMRQSNVTQFDNDAVLKLSTDLAFDSAGRTSSVTVSGINITSRTNTVVSIIDDRYPGQIKNALDQTSTLGAYDSRFGAVKTSGNLNGRNTTRTRDPFGRVTSVLTADGVIHSTTYNDCSSGCAFTVYGVSPSYWVQLKTSGGSTQLAPDKNIYYDNLGRVIRTQTESFSGSSYRTQDVKFDALGRVERSSMPYLTGATIYNVVPEYDLRSRVKKVTRADGGTTTIAYTTSNNLAIVTASDQVKDWRGVLVDTQAKRDEYNILGQLVKTTDGYGSSIDPSIAYTYDANGNVLTVKVDGGSTGITTTTFEYDRAGNQKKMVSPDMGTVTSTFTALGEVFTQTDAMAQESTYRYDALGRLRAHRTIDGDNVWTWDSAAYGTGELYSMTGPGYQETYSYFSTGKLKASSVDITSIGGSTSTNYKTQSNYDTHGRHTSTTYPSGLTVARNYNAQGFLSELLDGTTSLYKINALDAFGMSIDETYGNGVDTLRTFDPKTGRLTNVDTSNGSKVFQDEEYRWRTNGTLDTRFASSIDGIGTSREERYEYDVLNRVTKAKTLINGSWSRDMDYTFNDIGNITSKTSSLAGDVDVTGYVYGVGNAGPHAVTSATISGVGNTLTYNNNGAITKYDIAGTSNDKYIQYNAFNQPTKIVVGNSLTDTTPEAVDEFAYSPSGQRYARRTSWKDGANSYAEEVVYIGAVEVITEISSGNIVTTTKTRISPNVMHVTIASETATPEPERDPDPEPCFKYCPDLESIVNLTIAVKTTESFFEYAHRDHLGSITVVTDQSGNTLDNMASELFGSRKAKDWTSNIPPAELENLLALDSGHSRKVRGFTGHEHLDRTGFIHMNGRVYDPVLGRFLSPDPIVQNPTYSQSWNKYSYTWNSPASLTDPSGFVIQQGQPDNAIEEITVVGQQTGGGGGFGGFGGSIGGFGGFGGGGSGIGGDGFHGGGGGGSQAAGDTSEGDSEVDVDACNFMDAACTADVTYDAGGLHVIMTWRTGDNNVVVTVAIQRAGGISSLIGDGLNVVADAHLAAFSAALRGQPFRKAKVANLGGLLKPIKLFANKLGIAGLMIDVTLGINTFISTGNPAPLIVSGVGFGAATFIAAYSAPAALAFSVAYATAGYYGMFESNAFN